MKLKKCPKCGLYTLKEMCPRCNAKTINAHYKFIKIRTSEADISKNSEKITGIS